MPKCFMLIIARRPRLSRHRILERLNTSLEFGFAMHSLVSKYLMFVACFSAFGLVYFIYIVKLVSSKITYPSFTILATVSL